MNMGGEMVYILAQRLPGSPLCQLLFRVCVCLSVCVCLCVFLGLGLIRLSSHRVVCEYSFRMIDGDIFGFVGLCSGCKVLGNMLIEFSF